ncbi:MAG: hypothetical protein AMS22_07530 [Thiotrichales bacterium SG8_50]|nr:MAG: hypothetical protein AMS22_07530 [Thiotrichales bacterium SG8_50]
MALRVTRQHVEVLAPASDGELRVTRQHVEVLAPASDGKLRVTRQHVEVLAEASASFEEDVNSVMALSDDVAVGLNLTRSLTSNLSMTQTLPISIPASASSTLTLVHQAGRVKEESLTTNMAVSDIVSEFVSVGDFIGLSHDLNLTDLAEVTGLSNLVDSTMSMTQAVSVRGTIRISCQSKMFLNGFMPYEDKFERLSDAIDLVHGAGYPHQENVTTTMNMADEAYWSETPSSNLSLVQTLNAGKSKDIPASELDLTQVVQTNGVWDRTVTDSMGLGHTLTYYLPDPCDKKAYTPFIGESTSTSNPTPPDDSLEYIPRLPDGERFLLLYPALGESTDIVELRAPNLDNRDRQSFTRINRETRGGRLTIFADPTWPKIQTLILSFSGLTKTEVDDMQQFMVDHIGKEVGIIDWEGTQWVGIITTPNDRAAQDGRGCRWTLTFEFEGTIVEELPPGNHMNMSDSQTLIVEWHRTLTDVMVLDDVVEETVVSP